ncbi:hypothetical protein T4D_9343 [Trichinella pseudospiralis]|uniref:Uncharacterized protein n=1 Tax=Trichinella pseudospiralis TaxID=6337 RepID=A0A0V1FYU3_TRIPS|nr:hypothetical protein T4D_9343 [Trichinella pseudospiralis]
MTNSDILRVGRRLGRANLDEKAKQPTLLIYRAPEGIARRECIACMHVTAPLVQQRMSELPFVQVDVDFASPLLIRNDSPNCPNQEGLRLHFLILQFI